MGGVSHDAAVLWGTTAIESFMLNEETIEVNGNKLQGYGVEILGNTTGQPQRRDHGAKPVWDSPHPARDCIVTGAFDKPLTFLKTWTTTWC